MFKIGDIVEINAEAAATGMLDFTQNWSYRVHETRLSEYGGHLQVFMLNDSGFTGWYHQNHFKLKEDTKVEKKECLFKEGQVVWDTSYGRGVVTYSSEVQVQVKFDGQKEGHTWFTQEGVYRTWQQAARNRTLFFSEPKIEAATEPLFEPTLRKGDVVFAVHVTGHVDKFVILQEYEDEVHSQSGEILGKLSWAFYRLGEKINFK